MANADLEGASQAYARSLEIKETPGTLVLTLVSVGADAKFPAALYNLALAYVHTCVMLAGLTSVAVSTSLDSCLSQ